MSARWTDGQTDANVDVVLRRRLVRAAFQPIVRIDSGLTAALQASVRGPLSSPLEREEHLISAAARRGCVGALDTMCFDAVMEASYRARLQAPITVFVRRDAGTFGANAPAASASDGFNVAIVFDAAVATNVGHRVLADASSRARALGYDVALRVGSESDLATVAAIEPRVTLVDCERIDETTIETVAHGTTIVAANVDSELALEGARRLGIAFAYGLRFGRPDLLVRAPVLFDHAGVTARRSDITAP